METFNEKTYRATIVSLISDIDERDVKWLCNQCAKLYKRYDKATGCVDNFRVCKNSKDHPSYAQYEKTRSKGCCGFADVKVVNPLTGNEFLIGFNFGH